MAGDRNLVLRGGYGAHEPQKAAERFAPLLEQAGDSLAVYSDAFTICTTKRQRTTSKEEV